MTQISATGEIVTTDIKEQKITRLSASGSISETKVVNGKVVVTNIDKSGSVKVFEQSSKHAIESFSSLV